MWRGQTDRRNNPGWLGSWLVIRSSVHDNRYTIRCHSFWNWILTQVVNNLLFYKKVWCHLLLNTKQGAGCTLCGGEKLCREIKEYQQLKITRTFPPLHNDIKEQFHAFPFQQLFGDNLHQCCVCKHSLESISCSQCLNDVWTSFCVAWVQWQCKCSGTNPPTLVVEEPLHLHGWPGVSDAEHGAGNDALLSRGTVRGPHQAPVGLVVEPLQDLHSLAPAHRQLSAAAITGDEVVDHHCQFTATGELQGEQEKSDVRS